VRRFLARLIDGSKVLRSMGRSNSFATEIDLK
jgi:hypothetical protein